MHAPNHRVWAEIVLNRIHHNLEYIQETVGNDTGVMPIVKADAYGHGAVDVAQACSAWGADMFGVASIREALQLREANLSEPILIIGEILPTDVSDLIRYRLRPTVQSRSMIRRIGKKAEQGRSTVPVHLSLDTGMNRLGADSTEDALDLAKEVRGHDWLELEGASTHLSSAYGDDGRTFTEQQLSTFQSFLSRSSEIGIEYKYVHAANSGGVFSYPEAHFNLVRPGIAVYGVSTGNLSQNAPDLKQVMALRTRLLHIKKVEAGDPIGYGRSHRVDEETLIGVLPVGYHDGYPFQLSNDARVLIRGTSCPVVGRVTMDYVMVDLSPLEEVDVGDVVTLMGKDGAEQITASELSDRAGTISYEMLCSVGNRVQRIYKSSIERG